VRAHLPLGIGTRLRTVAVEREQAAVRVVLDHARRATARAEEQTRCDRSGARASVAPMEPRRFQVQIYYEDTDHSGLVYHANYLKYFERAREHVLGVDELVRLYRDEGIGFVVYKCELTFKEGAVFGDTIEIRSTATKESEYRVVFKQDVYRGEKLLVQGVVHMVCVDPNKKLVPLPPSVTGSLHT
jgi:tol-pal system-associated acyl-CoA thioesterase